MMKEIVDVSKFRTAEILQMLIDRDGLICTYPGCRNPEQFDIEGQGKNFPTLDHTMPKSAGGHPHDLNNLTIMHFACNNAKGSRLYISPGVLEDAPLREPKIYVQKREPCATCFEGQALLVGETCPMCGLDPSTRAFPFSLKRKPKECDHSTYHCWCCTLGFIERTSVIDGMIASAVDDLIEGTE